MAVILQPKVLAIVKQVQAMAIIRRGQLMHFVSQNKYIRLLYHRLAYISNVRVVRASKLVDDIQLEYDSNREYNLVEVFINSDDSDVFCMLSSEKSLMILSTIEVIPTTIVSQTIKDLDILNKLYILCISTKLIKVVRQNKSMTVTFNKLEDMHVKL